MGHDKNFKPSICEFVLIACFNHNSEDAEELSPLLKPFNSEKLNEDLRILVCAAEMDPPAFQQQSQEYTEKLQRKFGNVDSCLSEQDDHFTLVENLSLKSSFSASVTLNFLKSFL